MAGMGRVASKSHVLLKSRIGEYKGGIQSNLPLNWETNESIDCFIDDVYSQIYKDKHTYSFLKPPNTSMSTQRQYFLKKNPQHLAVVDLQRIPLPKEAVSTLTSSLPI